MLDSCPPLLGAADEHTIRRAPLRRVSFKGACVGARQPGGAAAAHPRLGAPGARAGALPAAEHGHCRGARAGAVQEPVRRLRLRPRARRSGPGAAQPRTGPAAQPVHGEVPGRARLPADVRSPVPRRRHHRPHQCCVRHRGLPVPERARRLRPAQRDGGGPVADPGVPVAAAGAGPGVRVAVRGLQQAHRDLLPEVPDGSGSPAGRGARARADRSQCHVPGCGLRGRLAGRDPALRRALHRRAPRAGLVGGAAPAPDRGALQGRLRVLLPAHHRGACAAFVHGRGRLRAGPLPADLRGRGLPGGVQPGPPQHRGHGFLRHAVPAGGGAVPHPGRHGRAAEQLLAHGRVRRGVDLPDLRAHRPARAGHDGCAVSRRPLRRVGHRPGRALGGLLHQRGAGVQRLHAAGVRGGSGTSSA